MSADNLARSLKAYRSAVRAAAKASEARAALPPGSSRARVTTANARWSAKAEARDRCAEDLAEACRDMLRELGESW